MQTHLSTEALSKPIEKSDKQTQSAFTALVYFRKGNGTAGRKFHSKKQDSRPCADSGTIITDHRFALAQLVKMITKDFFSAYSTAIIYENSTNRQVYKFCYDRVMFVADIEFKYHADRSVTFLKIKS